MTLRYAHLAPAHMRKAVNVVDTLLTLFPTCTTATNYTKTAQETKKSQHCLLTLIEFIWWAMLGLNQRPLPCEGSALPLS